MRPKFKLLKDDKLFQMSSIETTIIHDHIYLASFGARKESDRTDNRRMIRKKCDVQTDEDREEYLRRRTLNNASCRVSRIHRRSKVDLIMKKCIELEHLNTKLKFEQSILTEVIDQLKEHLRSLVPETSKKN